MYLIRLALFVVTMMALFAPTPARADSAFVFRTGFGERVFIPQNDFGSLNYLNVQNDVFFNPGYGVGVPQAAFFRAPVGVGFAFAPARAPVVFVAPRPALFQFNVIGPRVKLRR